VSIVVGRFIPGIKPVVSGVAGIMGMGAVRFTLLNLLSATAWAAVHILPGFSAGLTLRGLNVIRDGLAVVVGILAIGIVLAMWLAKGAIGSWLRHLTRLQIPLLDCVPPALQSARPIKNNSKPSPDRFKAARYLWICSTCGPNPVDRPDRFRQDAAGADAGDWGSVVADAMGQQAPGCLLGSCTANHQIAPAVLAGSRAPALLIARHAMPTRALPGTIGSKA
jgi:hypothetical protein